MDVRILLVSGEILEVEDATSVLQCNRRCFTREQFDKNNKLIEGSKAIPVPYQVDILASLGNTNGRSIPYDDVLKIEILFNPFEHKGLLK